MRILHATSPVAESGGVPPLVEALGRAYAAAGHDFVAVLPGEVDRLENRAWGRLVTVRAPLVPHSTGSRFVVDRPPVCEVVSRIRPDRVEVSDRLSLGWLGREAGLRGIPSVLYGREPLDARLRERCGPLFPARRVADARNRRLAAAFDSVVCTTEEAYREFARIGATNAGYVPAGIVDDRPVARRYLIAS